MMCYLQWMKRQQRVTFRRVGVIDPVDADDYEAHGGLAGLRVAMAFADRVNQHFDAEQPWNLAKQSTDSAKAALHDVDPSDYQGLIDGQKRIDELQEQLESIELTWMELSERLG